MPNLSNSMFGPSHQCSVVIGLALFPIIEQLTKTVFSFIDNAFMYRADKVACEVRQL